MSEPLLSIVIAAKDPPRELLQLCMASLAALKNASRAELVLVRSGELPELCAASLSRFASHSVIEVPPEGVYAAYNAGIRAASGTYLLFFGADDIALPDMDRVIDGLETGSSARHLVAAACYMQTVGIATPARWRASLAVRNWCHQGIFYLRSYLLDHPYQVEYRAQADHKMNIDIVSNRKLRFEVSPTLVAYFSAGGVSSMKPDLAFRRDFPSIVAHAYGRPFGALVKLKQLLIDAVLGDPSRRFKSRARH